MKPSDPTAVSRRFAAVLARGIARADEEIAEHFARLRALPVEDKPAPRPPWARERRSQRGSQKAHEAWLEDDE